MKTNDLGNLWLRTFGSKNPVIVIIAVNVFVFLVFGLLKLIGFPQFQPYTFLPGFLPDFWKQPWSLLTYMFSHFYLFNLIFNMLWLFWLGRIFLDFFSEKAFLKIYFGGGLVAAISFLLLFSVIPIFANSVQSYQLIGASACVFSLVIAIAILLPNYSLHLLLFGRVPLKYIAIAYVLLDLLTLGGGNPGISLAHWTGGVWGLLFALNMKGKLGFLIKNSKNNKLMRFGKKEKLKVIYNDRISNQSEKHDKVSQEIVDQILDKISKSGYESLSKKEKELLFKASNQENKTH